eukprot:TRINITY_DN246_c1_g1_i1.p1 TRINITY_DN246_c1_g1~~TRINITY_DN246_c1_g1_i1.p1  ORF type:complete len:528 (+),score=84.52 TRINITY_DN246_c1_g1_i1:1389-2972(+)
MVAEEDQFFAAMYAALGECYPQDPACRPLPPFPSKSAIREASFAQLAELKKRGRFFWELATQERLRRSAEKEVTLCDESKLNVHQYESQISCAAKSHEAAVLRALKELLVDEETKVVTRERFGHVVSILGPFDRNLFKKLARLVQHEWFHGYLSRNSAEALLRSKTRGTFLVRMSENSPRWVVLSKTGRDGAVRHMQLKAVGPECEDSECEESGGIAGGFEEEVRAMQERGVLTDACPGSVLALCFDGIGRVEEALPTNVCMEAGLPRAGSLPAIPEEAAADLGHGLFLVIGANLVAYECVRELLERGARDVHVWDETIVSGSGVGKGDDFVKAGHAGINRGEALKLCVAEAMPGCGVQQRVEVLTEFAASLVCKYLCVLDTDHEQQLATHVSLDEECRKYGTSYIAVFSHGYTWRVFADHGSHHLWQGDERSSHSGEEDGVLLMGDTARWVAMLPLRACVDVPAHALTSSTSRACHHPDQVSFNPLPCNDGRGWSNNSAMLHLAQLVLWRYQSALGCFPVRVLSTF